MTEIVERRQILRQIALNPEELLAPRASADIADDHEEPLLGGDVADPDVDVDCSPIPAKVGSLDASATGPLVQVSSSPDRRGQLVIEADQRRSQEFLSLEAEERAIGVTGLDDAPVSVCETVAIHHCIEDASIAGNLSLVEQDLRPKLLIGLP